MTQLSVKNLSFKSILQDVTVDVSSGEMLVVIGQSGSGKSTLLRCINRLIEPDAGVVRLGDVDTRELSVIDLRRRVGMIFQKTTPFAGTVADNIRYGCALHGETLTRERVLELMELASLEASLIDQDAYTLSGGQEQRLAIARALANQPDVLLLDEPTSALDPIATRHVEESLLKLDLTMVWVSHSIEQARRVADRVLLLDAGRVMRVDSVDAMLHPQTGDARALAFASGDESGLHG